MILCSQVKLDLFFAQEDLKGRDGQKPVVYQ